MYVCSVYISLIVSQVDLNAPIDLLLSCFFTLLKLFFSSIKYCSRYIMPLPIVHYFWCAIELQATIEDKRRHFMFHSSVSNVIFTYFFALPLFLQKFWFRSRKIDTDWAIFFRLECEITFSYYFVLFSFSFSFFSLCVLHHLLFIRIGSYRLTAITMYL